jgi:hypothetical protein
MMVYINVGIDVLLDMLDRPGSDTLIAQIDHAIERTDYFLLVAMQQAVEPAYCHNK